MYRWRCFRKYYLIEVISRELEDADHVGEISRRSVGEDDDLQTAGEQGAMEDVLLQNTLQHTQTHTFSFFLILSLLYYTQHSNQAETLHLLLQLHQL